MATFKGCNFKLDKPIFAKNEDDLNITTSLHFDSGNDKSVILNNIIIKKSPNKYDYDVYFCIDSERLNKNLYINLDYKGSYKQSIVYFEFIRSDNKAIEIVYRVNSSGLVELSNVDIKTVGPGVYQEAIKHCPQSLQNTEQKKCPFSAYLRSLEEELKFQKMQGGRKYKVTGGEYIEVKEQRAFSYGFELESELSIVEDSPVKLYINDREIIGNVLSLEGFHIVLVLNEYIGKNIPSAYITVTPWILLEALLKRLDGINAQHEIANLVIKNKCKKDKTIDDILKGQDEAFDKAVNSPVTIIWGPPGTGKTYTMTKIAMDFLQRGKTVLMVSHSNISVDGFVCELRKQISESGSVLLSNLVKNGRIFRYGFIKDDRLKDDNEIVAFNYAINQLPDLTKERKELQKKKKDIKDLNDPELVKINKRLNEIRKDVKDKERYLASNAKLLATTVSKVCIDDIFNHKSYDVVLFDEASMAYVPQVIMSAMYARDHFVCVGDFRQLSPICQNKKDTLITKDIFYYLDINNNYGKLQYHPWLVMLNEQRRMQPNIAEFSNQRFYNRLIENHYSTFLSRRKIVNSEPFAGKPVTLIDLTGTYSICGKNDDNSRYNLLSASIAFLTAIKAINEGKSKNVGIITPYVAQSRLIKSMIRDYGSDVDIVCSTVHQFQGSERDLIIFDAVESAPNLKPGLLMRSNDNNSLDRLINVALTRAKGKLVVIADCRYWQRTTETGPNTFMSLIRYLKDNGNVLSIENGGLKSYISNIHKSKNVHIYLNYSEITGQLYKSIESAKETILVSLADTIDLDDEKLFKTLDIRNARGVEVAGKTNDYNGLNKPWDEYIKVAEETCFPVIRIDNTDLYYGVPKTKGKIKTKGNEYYVQLPVYIRISGKHTTELFSSLSTLEYRLLCGTLKPLFGSLITESTENVSFKSYIENKIICPICGTPMKMTASSKGVFYLRCSSKSCSGMTYITTDMADDYIDDNEIKCSQHKKILVAKKGKFGVFAACSDGCTYGLNEI